MSRLIPTSCLETSLRRIGMQFRMMVGFYCFWKANIKLFSASRSGDRVKYPVMAKSRSTSERLATIRSGKESLSLGKVD